jgi:glyoxylase-like metal-dependent hydrolase (beta-lactamase superfamily II)
VVFHEGAAEIAPGVTLHRVGGHTQGLQVVRVATLRGFVVLASDASHYYANIRNRDPFPIVVDVGAMLEGYRTVERLADSPDHIVPGHDPEVLRLYPPAQASQGAVEAVALHLPPKLP